MAPKTAPTGQAGKGSGKSKQKSVELSQSSRIEFGLPQALVISLQAITARSTQDLWVAPTIVAGDTTVEQQAQRRATEIQKLSRRISGDMKAKVELEEALRSWMITISQHLVGLVGRVRALGAKVDEDLNAAAQDMARALRDQPSAATADQLTAATAALGPVWNAGQEETVHQLAAAMRAFGTVVPAAIGLSPPPHFAALGGEQTNVDTAMQMSAPLLGGGLSGQGPGHARQPQSMTIPHPAMGFQDARSSTTSGRWRGKRGAGQAERPSKSPRREVFAKEPSVPWPTAATGMTPESRRREPATVSTGEVELLHDPGLEHLTLTPSMSRMEDVQAELLPDHSPPSPRRSWFMAWLQVMQFALEQGQDLIGELTSLAAQDAGLPLHPDLQAEPQVRRQAQDLWARVGTVVQSRASSDMEDLYRNMQETLQQLRLCPNALPHLHQGLVLAIHVTLGTILDPYSYAPSTAQEWLYPGLLLEHGCPCAGFVPATATTEPAMALLLRTQCPFLTPATTLEDGAEF